MLINDSWCTNILLNRFPVLTQKLISYIGTVRQPVYKTGNFVFCILAGRYERYHFSSGVMCSKIINEHMAHPFQINLSLTIRINVRFLAWLIIIIALLLRANGRVVTKLTSLFMSLKSLQHWLQEDQYSGTLYSVYISHWYIKLCIN